MSARRTVSSLPALFTVATLLVTTACESPPARPETTTATGSTARIPTPDTPAPSRLLLVDDPSQVCMVNNQFMKRPQIPVQVGGKTYYGCCAMCKARLEGDSTARSAVDPVTQASVDKASAVIGAMPTGAVLYFASRENFDTYARRVR